MSTNLIVLIGMVLTGLVGLAVSTILKNDNGFLFSFFLLVAGSLSIGLLLTL